MLAAAGGVLVIVLGVNLATLLLMRAVSREREFAITRALGANPVAVVRATLLEAGLLGLVGGAGGALLGVWATRVLVALSPLNLPRRDSIAMDWKTAAVVVTTGLILGLLAGTVPATWAMGSNLAAVLRRAATRGGGGGALRRTLVVQVALSLVLLSASGLVVRSFERLTRAGPGFVSSGVLKFQLPVPAARYPDSTAATRLHERVERELAAIPGVTNVGAVSALPLSVETNQTIVTFPGAPGNTGDRDHDRPLIDYMTTRAGYFESMGIRTTAGRTLTPARTRGLYETVIDRSLAETFFPGRSALGATFLMDATR